MNLIALLPCRNESWIVGLSLRAALRWNDAVVVLLHACEDGSDEIVRAIAAEYPNRVHIIVESDPNWAEMSHRQRLLAEARKHGATHISLVDCDEVLTGNMLEQVRPQIEQLEPGTCLEVPMYAMWRSLDQYRTDGRLWAGRCDLALAFADSPELNWQPTNGYEHHHRQPHGSRLGFRARNWQAGVMHLQWASWPRLVAKHHAYRVMERLKYPHKSVHDIERTYSQAPNETGLQLAEATAEWWGPYSQWRDRVNLDTVPWHQQYVTEMVALHGREHFAGLSIDGAPVEAKQEGHYGGHPVTIAEFYETLNQFARR